MAPEYGGRSWKQLEETEKANVLIQLHKRGEQVDANLRAAASMSLKTHVVAIKGFRIICAFSCDEAEVDDFLIEWSGKSN